MLKLRFEPPVRLLFVRLVRLLVLGLFFIMALQNLGVDLLPLIAGLSVAGAGIALAMQGVLGKGIVEKFRETKIEIPFPQREIRLLGGCSPA